MAKLKVMCARSMHVAVGALGKAFAEGSGHEIAFDFGTVGALQGKLDAGETADVVILSVPGIDKLEKAGALVPGSRKNVAKTFIALCIREGAPRPDFSTTEAFKRLLENARAIATSDPAVGGSAGVHLAKAFEQTGLAAMMAPQEHAAAERRRGRQARGRGQGRVRADAVGRGRLGPGRGDRRPVPPPFGQDTTYCAAVMAGSGAKEGALAFIAALTRPDTRTTWAKAGFELP